MLYSSYDRKDANRHGGRLRRYRQALGYLRGLYSHNTAGWANIPIPIAVVANGSGPTLLALGGNHGDEYEGPVALMNAGRIIQEGTPREVYSRPASVFASGFISEANLFQGTVVKTEDIIVTLPTGEGKHVKAKSSL